MSNGLTDSPMSQSQVTDQEDHEIVIEDSVEEPIIVEDAPAQVATQPSAPKKKTAQERINRRFINKLQCKIVSHGASSSALTHKARRHIPKACSA